MAERNDILFPVGRMVMGDLYEPNTKDAEGKPLLVKNGPNAGQPRVEYFIAVAIPKAGEQHWAHTAWGQVIYATGSTAFPAASQAPTFSWKVEDGDSQIPNMKGRKPCDNEGWRGHWIVKFASGYAPKVLTADGSREIAEPGAVKPGYYVQVFGNVVGNGSQQRPGVRLNPNGIALAGYGPEIQVGRDMSQVGFGQGVQLPAGASATPLAGMQAAPVPFQAPVPAVPAAAPVPAAAAPVPVQAPVQVPPNPAVLHVPAAAAVPAAPAARQMTPKAAGATYEQFIAGGWTDATLIAQGFMLG